MIKLILIECRSTISERTLKKGLENWLALIGSIVLPPSFEALDQVGIQVILGGRGGIASSTRKDESESRSDYPIREVLEKFSPVETQLITRLSSGGSSTSVTST